MKGLRQASALLNDPEVTLDAAKKKSKACATFIEWLDDIVRYNG